MTDKLLFSRDTQVFLKVLNANSYWRLDVLDGFSFSQATNAGEITLNEMSSSTGSSRRARQMFNNSVAPAEWSFSTYAQPHGNTTGSADTPLWALLAGEANNMSGNDFRSAANVAYTTGSADSYDISFAESNKTQLGTADIYFVMGVPNIDSPQSSQFIDPSDVTAYKLSGCCVNEITVDFDLENLTINNWSGLAKKIEEVSVLPVAGNTGNAYNEDQLMLGSNAITIADGSNGAQTITDYSTTNTKFIRNKLTELRAVQTDTETGTEARRNLLSHVYPNAIGAASLVNNYLKSSTANVDTSGSAGSLEDFVQVGTTGPTVTSLFSTTTHTGDHYLEIYALLDGSSVTTPPQAIVAGETHTYSVYVKKPTAGDYRYISFSTYTDSNPIDDQIGVVWDFDEAQFVEHANLSDTEGQSAVKVTDDGWYRLSFTGPAPDGTGAVNANSGATRVAFRVGDTTSAFESSSSSNYRRLVYNDGGASANTATAGTFMTGFQIEKGHEVSPLQVYNPASAPTSNAKDPYNLTITGGSISISNNITFLTPETLGVVNEPLGHVTGTRSISGSFTCYLDGSLMGSSELFADIVDEREVTNSFNLSFRIGAGGTDAKPQIRFNLPKCHLEIPTHNIEDIVSLETNFHALPSDYNAADEVSVSYLAD